MLILISLQLILIFLALGLVVQPVIIYLQDRRKLRRFPSVPLAGFTDLWGVWHQYNHTRTMAVHAAHQKHGKVVRVGTRHLSFATVGACRDIYGHGTPALKDDFYKSFTSTHLNISDAQEKSVHNVKRRRFAAALAQKSVVQMEPVMQDHLRRLAALLDAKSGGTVVDMKRLMLHTMYNFISVVMYAQDPRFLENESTMTTAETPDGRLYKADMYQSMVDSSHIGIATGWAPRSMGMLQWITQWHPGWRSGSGLRDVTIHLVRNRLKMDSERIRNGQAPLEDLFTSMLYAPRGEKEPLGLELGELLTEAANMFNAAGENSEIALTNIIWLLARNPGAMAKLRDEIDGCVDYTAEKEEQFLPTYDQIKDLPYLRACIDEGLRLRPSIEGGLPRMVPNDSTGMYVDGEWLEPGTTISVSTHTMHRDPEVFGEQPESFIPERWLRPEAASMQRGFLAFSQGGRGCIGRNIAYFEMSLVIALLVSRYDLTLISPDFVLGIEENFSAHTVAFPVRVERRR